MANIWLKYGWNIWFTLQFPFNGHLRNRFIGASDTMFHGPGIPSKDLKWSSCFMMFHGSLEIWLVVGPPLWKMVVNWDDEIPNISGRIKLMFQSTNQRSLSVKRNTTPQSSIGSIPPCGPGPVGQCQQHHKENSFLDDGWIPFTLRLFNIWVADNIYIYVQFNAMHKLGSSPIGCEGFVQPRKGQGEARL